MTQELRFTNFPAGATIKEVPTAKLAETDTTIELTNDQEADASYFRFLEEEGIFLNQRQLEAVRQVDGPTLIVAGAGSGKTRVLISRAGYLLMVKKVKPENLLIVTFSKKAADEIKDRITKLPNLPQGIGKRLQSGTFHSIFLWLLRKQGYTEKILANEKYKELIIKILLKELGLQDAYQPETLLALFSSYKVNMKTMEEIPEKTSIEKELKQIYRLYENWKKENHYLDFDDILYQSYSLLGSNEKLLTLLQNRFQYIMVDEFQDTNPISYQLIKLLADGRENLFIVGDSDQTIYSFNGSDVSAILNFPKEYLDCKVITLDINYRSTTSIVGLGNAIIKHNENRYSKNLKATKVNDQTPKFLRPVHSDEEAKKIVDHIVEQVAEKKRSYSDYAILYRTASSSRAIFERMVLDDIPFFSFNEGDMFYNNSIIKPVVSYFRLTLNSNDLDAIEAILPSLYIAKERAIAHIQEEELFQPSSKQNQNHLMTLLTLPDLKEFQKKQLNERLQMIKGLKEKTAIEAIQEIRKSYDKYLETDDRKSLTLNKELYSEMLDELESSAKRFSSIEDFLSFIDLMNQKNQQMKELKQGSSLDAINLMTIHKSKGLEFPYVFVIGVSEGILPHSSAIEVDKFDQLNKNKQNEAIEEERRLLYVATTRAIKEVYISSPMIYRGKKIEVSRFLQDVFFPSKTNGESNKKTTKNNNPHATKQKVEIEAWICSSSSCNIWQRIDEDPKTSTSLIKTNTNIIKTNTNIIKTSTSLIKKNCPVCGATMNHGKKNL